jgi:hypothetical protein
MKKMTKVAAAISVAIGTAGMGVSQADEYMFGYVVSSPTVTTVLSLVNTEQNFIGVPPTALHWEYRYKEGAAALDNDAECVPGSTSFTSSPNDLVSISVDEAYGAATRAVLFNDPMLLATYTSPSPTLGLLRGLTAPVRAFALVDNNGVNPAAIPADIGPDGSLTAGRATILEFINGAAWGYMGYNPIGDFATNGGTFDFSETQEVFYEVFGPNVRLDGTDFSYKPFDEFTTMFFVTPISGPNDTNADGTNPPIDQRENDLQVRVTLSAPGAGPGFVSYDRDEGLVDGRLPDNVTCVGAVTVESLMSTLAAGIVAGTGGWAHIDTDFIGTPATALPGSTTIRTDEATIMFLEHNGTGGTFNGEPINGVVNNGYMMQEL